MKTCIEPYVTTKPKGTGLGLVIVKKIVEDLTVKCARERAQQGARVTISCRPRQRSRTAQNRA